MAIFAATDYTVTVNAVDLTDHITSVELPLEAADLDTTNFGTDGWNSRIGGLKSGTVSINFQQDFAASEVDATLWPLLGTVTAVTVAPTGSAASATNPHYEFSALVTQTTPISGAVGDLATMSVSWPISGAVTRDVGA